MGCRSPACRLWGPLRAGAGGGGRGQTPAPRAPAPPSCGARTRAMLHGKRIYRSASCAGAEDTEARIASCHPRRVSENDLSDPPCPLTMLAPWIPGRAAILSSVSNLSLPRLFGHAREPDRRAEDALGDTRRLAPETEGKPGLTHSRGASPSAQPGPRMWGAGTGTASSDLSPARVRGCCGAGSPPLAEHCAAATPVRARSLARPPACSSTADPGHRTRAARLLLLLLQLPASPASPGFLPKPASKLACWDGSVRSLPPLFQVSSSFLV